MAYTIVLTPQDLRTIAFIGHRYSWSTWACRLVEGNNELSEPEAWEFNEQIAEDTQGGHSAFPMLDPGSNLYLKLTEFTENIV